MNIQPNEIKKNFVYYTGVYKPLENVGVKEKELFETVVAHSGSRIEDYFPLVIECMNKRGNWICLTAKEAQSYPHIDFSWTNASKICHKSAIHSRILLDSVNHYISNKAAFYTKFKDSSFIPQFHAVSKNTLVDQSDEINEKFRNKSVIAKPNLGSISRGILVQNHFDYHKIYEHIKKNKFDDWTISEIIKPRLIDDYVSTCRIYFLVTKMNNKYIKGYYYNHFMIYRAENKFKGDITDPLQFLTNYMDRTDPLADEKFVKERYISYKQWLSHFTSEEQIKINDDLSKMLNKICTTMKNDILAFNDNKNTTRISYHVYGLDVMIDNDCNLKLIEINGAPAMNIKSRYYELHDRLDYFDLVDELFQKTVDQIYPPTNSHPKLDNFVQIYSGETDSNILLPLYYIPNSILTKYPFIHDAFKKRDYIRRTKCLYDNIDIFYGLRERYVTDITSMNYYDEILNYLTSKRTRNASIINKIQGVTYYLANKSRIYSKLLENNKKRKVHKYHPVSKILFYSGDKKRLKKQLDKIIHRYDNIDTWILKPVHGSRGMGIKIFRDDSHWLVSYWVNSKKIVEDMVEHIEYYSIHGHEFIEKNNIVTFDGQVQDVRKYNKYRYWIVSQYIDKPHLIKLKDDCVGRKYNIRFYVLLNIKNKIPVYKDICGFNNSENVIETYLWHDYMLYFSMLEYDCKKMPNRFKDLDKEKYLERMKNLTNLEIVNNSYDELNDMNRNYYYDKVQAKKDLTGLLTDFYSKKSKQFRKIKCQIINMVKDTINSVKYDLRPLNRHRENYKGCFNLLAYDTMLDEKGRLWLIEINRGPDINGLYLNLGYEKSVKFFDDIFKITMDPYYQCHKTEKVEDWERIPISYQSIRHEKN